MSGSAMNAFLKTAEEPLRNRFIIATLPHQSMLLDTIISRAVVIRFEELSYEEMKRFAEENTIQNSDSNLQHLLIAMAMGKPGTLLQIHQQLEKNPELFQALVTAEKVLLDKKSSLVAQQKILKQILDAGLLQSFIDGRINYLTNQKLFLEADKRLQRKKMQNANVNQENLLLYGVL
jgi:DNA polymerase III delta prime subunit